MSDFDAASLVERLAKAIPIDQNGIGNTWPVFADAELFSDVVEALAKPFAGQSVTKVVGIEARGFVLGPAVAHVLGAGFVGIRKPGGLYPGEVFENQMSPDYRGNQFVLRLRKEALNTHDRVILVDDWFETGGQAKASIALIERSGAQYLGASIVVDWLQPTTRDELGNVRSIVDIITLPLPAGSRGAGQSNE